MLGLPRERVSVPGVLCIGFCDVKVVCVQGKNTLHTIQHRNWVADGRCYYMLTFMSWPVTRRNREQQQQRKTHTAKTGWQFKKRNSNKIKSWFTWKNDDFVKCWAKRRIEKWIEPNLIIIRPHTMTQCDPAGRNRSQYSKQLFSFHSQCFPSNFAMLN